MISNLPLLRASFRRDPMAALGVVIALVILIELQIFVTYRQLQEVTDDLHRCQSTLIAIEHAIGGAFFGVELSTCPEPADVAAAIGPLV
ncbi:MAG TPA: hypothetical protein VGR01_15400 [Burkholderiales bacterium]|nr:hypothetical protein [Burkholderiales bacterium]